MAVFSFLVSGCTGNRDERLSSPEQAGAKTERSGKFSTGAPPGKPRFVFKKGGMKLWLCLKRENRPAENADATIEFDETALLGVVVQKGGTYYTDIGGLVINGRKIEGERIKSLGALPGWESVRWYKVESGKSNYMNTEKNDGWWAEVQYVESVYAAGRETTREVDVRPLHLGGVEWNGRFVGTMRYRVSVEFPDFILSTSGKEAAGKGGVCPGARRVSRKGGTGSAAVDHVMSLANLPYIWGSAPVEGEDSPESHQAELYIGADCADLVVAAWHKAGVSAAAYTAVIPMINKCGGGPQGIKVVFAKKGFFYRKGGKPIMIGPGGIKPGAAVAWRFGKNNHKGHMAMLVEDSGPGNKANAVFDEHDLVFHAIWDTPSLVSVKDAMPGVTPVMVINPIPVE